VPACSLGEAMYATELIKVQLPLPLLALGLAFWLVVTLRALRGQGAIFRALYLALSIRLLLGFFHEQTTGPVIAGQSVASLVTIAIIAIGLYLVRHELLRFKAVLPVYAFCFILVFSGIFNAQTMGMVEALLRQLLFVAVLLLWVRMLDATAKDHSFSDRLLSLFFTPLLLQVISVVAGVETFSQESYLVGYIGGYLHESVFSSMMLSGMCIAALAPGLTFRRRTVYVVIFFASIVVGNYRTALLATLPLMIAHFVVGSGLGFKRDTATVVRLAAAAAVGIGGIGFMSFVSERLADIALFAAEFSDLIKPPNEFTSADRMLLAGRVLLWSDYVHATVTSSPSHILFGFGPESWVHEFGVYAHNVFVSYIYEVGVVGLLTYLLLSLYFLHLAYSSRHPMRWVLVSCHLTYHLLSLGTMPTQQIEGVFLYAIICGFTLYYKLTEEQRTWFIFDGVRSSRIMARTARRA
jgi:hypothetical protein